MKGCCYVYGGDFVIGIGRAWAAVGLSRYGDRWFPRAYRLDKYVLGLSWLWLYVQAGYNHLDPGAPMSAVWEPKNKVRS